METHFAQLKLVCDSILQNPSKEKLNALFDLLSSLNPTFVQMLHEYILFPLHVLLYEKKSQCSIRYEVMVVLKFVLKKIKMRKFQLFKKLHLSIVIQILDLTENCIDNTVDEDFKLITVQCIKALYKSYICDDNILEFYVRLNAVTMLSSVVFMSIKLVLNEKMRLLRISAIECVMIVMHVHDTVDFSDVVVQNQIADATLVLLPGISIGLKDVMLGEEKQGHKITTLAVKAFTRIILLFFRDDKNFDEKRIVFELTAQAELIKEQDIDDKNVLQIEKRDPDWLKSVEKKFALIFESLIPLQYHTHEKVRFKIVEMCEEVIFNCPRNLVLSLKHCLQMLIVLSEDNDLNVSDKSKKVLDIASKNCMDIFNKSLVEIIESDFYNVINKIPRIINGSDLSERLSALNLLAGYLRLLGPNNLSRVLHSSQFLNRLMQCLIHIAQLEIMNILIFEEYAIRDFESISELPTTWKHFKYIEEKPLQLKFKQICQILSESNAVNIIIDYLNELFLNDYGCCNEAVLLLNEILSTKSDNSEERLRIVRDILKLYLDENNWYLPLQIDKSDGIVSLNEVRYNVVQVCLLVEGVGMIAGALAQNFSQFLFKTLYFVLERAGSSQTLVSTAGLMALSNISTACSYKTVTQLITENADYFSFHVVRRLKKLDENDSVLDVLNVVLKYSTVDVLPPIMDILNGILLQCCDKYEEHNITNFLKVFYSFVLSLKRWYNIKEPQNNDLFILKGYMDSMNFIYSFYELNTFSQEEQDDQSAEETNEEELDADGLIEDKKPEVPAHIKLSAEILNRSLHFMPSKNLTQKLLVLDILREGIQILGDWKDECLPLVHLIWSPLVDRFNETMEPLVLNKSFELLTVLGRISKEFIRFRTSKNVFPKICSTLKNLAQESYLKDRGSVYRYTQKYKLQLMLLKNLAQLITDLDMTHEDVGLAVAAARPYLSNKQPLPLQECCREFYKCLALFDFDSVWLYAIGVWGAAGGQNAEERTNLEEVLLTLDRAKW